MINGTTTISVKNAFVLTLILLIAMRTESAGQEHKKSINLPMISAHRGALRSAPENTLSAFSKAIVAGADFIEIDVRTSSDGAQVIMHDGSLKRTTGLDEKVERTDLATIKKLSAGQDEKVPTLDEVCQLVVKANKDHNRVVKLYVDCKAINAEMVIRTLEQHHLLDSAVFYGDLPTLAGIKRICPGARAMPAYPGKAEFESVAEQLDPYAFDVSFNQLDKATLSACHAKGIKVFSDLLGEDDTLSAYRKAIQLGVDLIQTDDVSNVRKVFKEFE